MKRIPCFSSENLQSISDILGDTYAGLTGSEIGQILLQCGIDDVSPEITKRHRIYNAFAEYQNRKQYGNHVVGFIHKAMNPVRYTDNPDLFESRRVKLNAVLAFSGLGLGEDGKIRYTDKVTTLAEAKEREGKLRNELTIRKVHQDVLQFCRAELLQENYFHAVFEATKSIADKIRNKSGLNIDCAELVREAFSIGKSKNPILAINDLSSPTEESEQKGFVNLLIGLFGMFRNTTAHIPKIRWEINERDALDILSLASLVHRKLDITKKL